LTFDRLIVLIGGPALLIAGSYALSFPAWRAGRTARAAQVAEAERRSWQARAEGERSLAAACAQAADELSASLPESSHILVRPPFVLAGNLAEKDLERLHRQAVLPAVAALWRSFFDHKPDQPVTIVLLRDEASYHAVAMSLDGYEPRAYAGYTQRGVRRIVCNLETGQGTLIHELAHALAAFDFPEMPEWFDEGLAALHEDAVFSPDGLTLSGMRNWRSQLLDGALQRDELPTLESVITAADFRDEGEGLNYAVVRAFCHYLQDRGLLSHFYRKFRSAVHDDPNGVATLCALLGAPTLADVERDFREWVATGTAR
jgi:hypothetical protein